MSETRLRDLERAGKSPERRAEEHDILWEAHEERADRRRWWKENRDMAARAFAICTGLVSAALLLREAWRALLGG